MDKTKRFLFKENNTFNLKVNSSSEKQRLTIKGDVSLTISVVNNRKSDITRLNIENAFNNHDTSDATFFNVMEIVGA